MRGTLLLGYALAIAACDDAGAPSASGRDASPWLDPTGAATRRPRVAKVEDIPEIGTPPQPEAAALEALVAAAPEVEPRPTGADGDTAVGSDTGLPEAEETPALAPTREPKVQGGDVQIQPPVSSPAIERQARAQIYWGLRGCRGPDGRPPAPETITLAFTLREDGTVDPASVTAKTIDPALQPTAECVLRTFSATPFQGPEAARGAPARIVITWPSVD